MGHLVTAVPIIFIIWLLVQVTRMYANYAKANRAGLPIIVAPFVQYNKAWGLFQTFFQPEKWLIPLLQAVLPEPASRFTRVIHMNWVRENGPDLHRRLGPVFFIVSPSCIVFISADNLANTDFLTNAKKWTRLFPNEALSTLFGKNIVVAHGKEWRRHRRVIGPSLNESTSECVWQETRKQMQGAMDMIQANTDYKQLSVFKDSRTITLHVFLAVAFGLPHDFATGARQKLPGQTLSLHESLGACVENVLITWVGKVLGPRWVRFFPQSVRRARKAWEETDTILQTLLAKEEERPTAEGRTLLSQLIKNSREEDAEEKQEGSARRGMSRSEVIGNLFTLIRTGHETTASTISIAIALLAAHPQYQRWVQDEIDGVVADGIDAADYQMAFPRLKRLQAVMFETARLYHPLVINLRYAPSDSTTQLSDGRVVLLPAKTLLQMNLHVAYCTDPVWGDSPGEFRPDRFIIPRRSEKAGWPEYRPQPESDTAEKLVSPGQNISSFWGAGPHICVAVKFSQVEFVCALFTAFSEASAEPFVQPEPANSGVHFKARKQQACEKLKGILQRSGHSPRGSLLHVFEPEKVVLTWRRRREEVQDY